MKTLTIEHIASYLPYGLKFKHMAGVTYSVECLTLYQDHWWVNLGLSGIRPSSLKNIRPALVPLDKLTDAQYAEVGRLIANDSAYAQNWLLEENYHGLVNFEEAIKAIQHLHSLRCDIYGLIPAGLAISALDLPENPYL